MKTLDEVIKKIEACIKADGHCSACPYEVSESCGDMDADALHYLKEYRKDKQIYSYDIARRNFELAERNDPLSWDELKAMKGKPVWVELTYPEGGYSHWGIIEGFPIAGYEFMDLRGFHQIDSFSVVAKEQGKTWQAYRKERE